MLGGNTHAERGLRLAEVILSRQAAQGPGSRLPTERQLASDLGVTRSSIRHALAMLEAQGRISREVGRGTFLRDVPPSRTAPQAAADGGPDGGIGAAAAGPGLLPWWPGPRISPPPT